MNEIPTESLSLPPAPGGAAGVDTRLMRAAIAQDLFDAPAAPVQIGRFEILRRIGAGAMGDVFAAHDPQLGRTVAVKLVRAERRDAHTASLLREARALAKLVHPRVVTIFESGVHDGEVFLAMEYFDGGSLAQWIDAHPVRTRADVWATLAKFVDAGVGLAAAHAAGLVHRDFKPANVLLATDGRIAVADFGLAGTTRTAAPDPVPGAPSSLEQTSMTLAGGGTPAYMAPEQFRGDADARADQYAFCVALFEGLVGSRPGVSALDAERADIARRMPTTAARLVPRWIRAALVRGLASDPSARFPSMEALLVALDRRRHTARRRTAVVVGFVAAGLGGAWALAAPSPCASLSTDGAIWSGPRRAAVEAAYLATGQAPAATFFGEIDEALIDWSRDWAAARRDACEASHGAGQQSAARADARADCLEHARVSIDATIDAFIDVDPRTIANTRDVLARLPSIGRCEDPQALAAADEVAAIDRAAYDAAFAEVARARARLAAGQVVRLDDLQRAALDAVDPTRHPHLAAEVQLMIGEADGLVDAATSLEQHLVPAARLAVASGDRILIAEAMIAVGAWVSAADGSKDSLRWFDLAEGALEGTTEADRLRDSVLVARVEALTNADDHAAVVDLVESALAGGDLAQRTRLYICAPAIFSLAKIGRTTRAIELGEEVVREAETYFGVESTVTEAALSNLGDAYSYAGRNAEALVVKSRLVELDARLFGPDSSYVAWGRASRAWLLVELGRLDEAQAEATAALAIARGASDDSAIVHAGQAASHVAGAKGLHDVAIALRIELRPHVPHAFGETGLANAAWDASLAEHLLAAGRPAEAVRWAEGAAAHVARHHPASVEGDPASVVPRLVLANANSQLGRPAEALAAIDAIAAAIPESTRQELAPVVARHRGEVLARLGRRAEAAVEFSTAIAALDRVGPGPDAETLGLLAGLAVTTTDPAIASAAADRAVAMAKALGVAVPPLDRRGAPAAP